MAMNTGEYSGGLDSQQPHFPLGIGDMDIEVSEEGSMSESLLPQTGGQIHFGEDIAASGSIPNNITHVGPGNRQVLPPAPRRSQRKDSATATGPIEQPAEIEMEQEGVSERIRLLREVKKSFDDLQNSKRILTTNERWGQLFGIMIDDFPADVQDDFKFYVQCLAIATKRGLTTIPNAHKVLTGDWVVIMNLPNDSE